MEYFTNRLHGKRKGALSLAAFRTFVDVAVHLADIDDAPNASFWRCEEGFIGLAKSGAILEYAEQEILRGMQIPEYMPEFTLLECDTFRLHLRVVNPGRPKATVLAMPHHRMIYVVEGSVKLDKFEQPRPDPQHIFDPLRKLVRRGSQTLKRGDHISIRALSDSCDFSVDEFAILLELHSACVGRFEWHYDLVTLSPKWILSSDGGEMRAELALMTAANLGSSDSVVHVASLLDHENPFVRASALKALLRLDKDGARACLCKAGEAKHPPEVRKAMNINGAEQAGNEWH